MTDDPSPLIPPARVTTTRVTTTHGISPLRLVLVGGMGSIGINFYPLQQPADALAVLPGVEVFELESPQVPERTDRP